MSLKISSKFNNAYIYIYFFSIYERVIIRIEITHLQNVFRLVLPIELPSAGRDQTWNIIEWRIRATALINPRLNGISIKVSGLTFYRRPRSGKPTPQSKIGGGEEGQFSMAIYEEMKRPRLAGTRISSMPKVFAKL